MIEGRYFAPRSARSAPARASCVGATVRIDHAGAFTLHETWRASSRMAGVPRRIEFADGAAFETDDDDGVDRLLAAAGRVPRIAVASLERFRPRLIGFALAGLILAAIAIIWGVPLAGDLAARMMPREFEAIIGDGALDSLDRAMTSPSRLPAPRQAALRRIFDDLARAADAPGIRFRLELRDGRAIGANALALPGGVVIVTDQLVALAPDDDAIAGVLAHEIGHVVERHGTRRMGRALGVSLLIAIIVGDPTPVLSQAGTFAATALDLAYSREFERDADDYGARLLARTGRSPQALADMLERLQAAQRGEAPAWLSSHPATRERIDALRGPR